MQKYTLEIPLIYKYDVEQYEEYTKNFEDIFKDFGSITATINSISGYILIFGFFTFYSMLGVMINKHFLLDKANYQFNKYKRTLELAYKQL